MPGNLSLSLGTLCAFLLVLARVSGAFVFVPLPGANAAPATVRVVLSVGITLALQSRWPAINAAAITPAQLTGWALVEAGLGVGIGVAVSMILEVFVLSGQLLGLQAGYGYASTIDPNTQADSGILLVFAELFAGLLFFSAGLDRDILRLFAASLDRVPPGTYRFGLSSAGSLIHLGGSLFTIALRLALPVIALMVMVDVALALLGRVNAQLQLLTLAFPAKMLISLLVLSWIAVLFPRISGEIGGLALGAARHTLGL
ncbi:MAG TPA: flagellar biosynthetic protein FliR [Bryobacteraceae bacterium]|nr:flagellar biosynthetic protein FliR [Bryobacteraceae bacterium]